MDRPSRTLFLIAGITALAAPRLRADSLVTTDGDVLIGSVTRTASGYTIKTSDGPVEIAAEKVKRILYDHPPADAQHPIAAQPGAAYPNAVKTDPREVAELLRQGQAAMAAGEFPDARDAFTDLLAIDKTNTTAGRGLGFAYLKMEKPLKAVKPLELAALTPPIDRSLTMALSASLVASHNPMRAVKFLKAYLDAHPTPPDEPLINALGIALSQADSAASKLPLFVESVKLYNKLDADLEANQPGKKRWGIEWQDAEAVTAKQKVRQDAQKKVDDAWARLQAANAQLSSAQSELASANNAPGRRAKRDQLIKAAQDHVNAASTAVDKAQSKFDEVDNALAQIPGPIFPDVVALEDVDLSMSAGAAIAAATPGPPAGPAPANNVQPLTVPPIQTAPPVSDDPDRQVVVAPAAKPASTTTRPAPNSAAAPAHVTRYAVGFAVAADLIVTAASTVEGATDIHIDTADGKTINAQVVRTLHGQGLALLKVTGAHLPTLSLASAPSTGSMNCLGYPEVSVFNPVAKQMTASGTTQGDSWTVSLNMAPRLPGGPLLGSKGVVGVELGDRDSDIGQIPAATLKSLETLLRDTAPSGSPANDPKQALVLVTAVH